MERNNSLNNPDRTEGPSEASSEEALMSATTPSQG
jgi:hypothetical protein